MFNFKKIGYARLPHHKGTMSMPAVAVPSPSEVLFPTLQHIGAPAKPIVKVGDEVKVGQKIAEADGKVSAPIHSSVSGKVVKIEDYLSPAGGVVPAIRIESDGLLTPYENICPPDVHDFESFIAAVRESGIVGLGGAGFPTAVKLEALGSGEIEYVIINGAECEPYATSDARMMLDEAEWIEKGIELLKKYSASSLKFIIGIEKDKKECIDTLTKRFENNDDVKVETLSTRYPQGGEKIIIYNTLHRVVEYGKLPKDIGVLVINVSTIAEIAKYIATGMPLVFRTVTVDGSAIAEPKNIIAPIGTPIEELIEFSGGFKDECAKLIVGGPMMGYATYSMREPTIKTTGVVVGLVKKDCPVGRETACIRCGKCIEACPLNLSPVLYSNDLMIEDKEERIASLRRHNVALCMECGSCAYYCPAHRPLVQNSRLGKTELRNYDAHKATLKN